MKIIVGLGNPEEKYRDTPHNVGFDALDLFTTLHNFSVAKKESKFRALVSEKQMGKDIVRAVWPQTFMNNSGDAVARLMRFYKCAVKDLIVLHDDIDILAGSIKIARSRGAAGHKGIVSIIEQLGTQGFTRARIGIQPVTGKPTNIETFVLKRFAPEQRKLVANGIQKSVYAIARILQEEAKAQ